MPQQVTVAVENNFTKGLITESTGLNFPENAATDCDNCEFTLIGDVLRREGINYEFPSVGIVTDLFGCAFSSYIWNNAGGDDITKLYVRQSGRTLYFYAINNVTVNNSISSEALSANVDIGAHRINFDVPFDSSLECTYADGNGYLFVYNPQCDPFYVAYNNGVLTATSITLNVRDFGGVDDNLAISTRPANASSEHIYNLLNQGWVSGQPWQAFANTAYTIGNPNVHSFGVPAGIVGVVAGQIVSIAYAGSPGIAFGLPATGTIVGAGTIISYTGTVMTINITSVTPGLAPATGSSWNIVPTSIGFIETFITAANTYPSNADVWWYFKDNTGAFDPGTTLANVSFSTGLAPRGHYLLNPFVQSRSTVSGQPNITFVGTIARPTNGAWFQGRVWYTGVNANSPATGDAYSYTWTENIYFSQIVETVNDFGTCYQVNDPTSENLNGLLPSDGGVIKIVGTGKIHKLFVIANGLLVFANNGIWFITGSQGIGFTANDYTVTKISSIKVLSPYSFVDVNGLPMFWNEEGIYQVNQSPNGGFSVDPITVSTILSFYNEIPTASKYYCRGDYNPVDYVVQWTYRSTNETSINDRYHFDKILNYNVYNKAFYPYTVGTGDDLQFINGVNYISYPNITSETPDAGFVYPATKHANTLYFALMNDETYVDWGQTNYVSYFTTGYKIRGQGIKKFQPQYIQLYNRTNGEALGYKIQGLWDYSSTRNSGRWSSLQAVTTFNPNYAVFPRRHKIRGHGYALQFKVLSQDGMPFDVIGWAVVDTVNSGT